MRWLATLACAIWCLVLLPNAGMIWVGMRYGDQPLVWWVALLFVGVPIAAALFSVLLPWRLRVAGLKKTAAYATGALFVLALAGLTGEAWLLQSP